MQPQVIDKFVYEDDIAVETFIDGDSKSVKPTITDPIQEMENEESRKPSGESSPVDKKKKVSVNTTQEPGDIHRSESHYEELMHPNMMESAGSVTDASYEGEKNQFGVEKSYRNYDKRKKKDCAYYFAKLDYEILRHIFIYKYDRDQMHRQDQLLELQRRDANLINEIYG